MRLVRVAEFAVHLVGDEEEVVPAAEVADGEHLVLGEELAGRIARVADQHGAGPGGHALLEFGDVGDAETLVDVGRDHREGDVVQEGEGLVVRVEGLDDEDLLAWARRDLHGHGEGFAAGHVHEQLAHFDVDADLLVVFVHQALAELHQAG